MDAAWDDISTLLRARMNQRLERCRAAGIQPKVMILDGVSLHRKLLHTSPDARHFRDQHDSYTRGKDGVPTRAVAAKLFADQTLKTAKLAAWFLSQPPGGSDAQGPVYELSLIHISEPTRPEPI
eukprot:4103113-Pyramimonas_sp.AAC.1